MWKNKNKMEEMLDTMLKKQITIQMELSKK